MQTRLEMFAAAYPLHYQRIVEEIFRQDDDVARFNRLDRPAAPWQNARYLLSIAFAWSASAEGFTYWDSLRRGAPV